MHVVTIVPGMSSLVGEPLDPFKLDFRPLRKVRQMLDVRVEDLARWAGMSTWTVYRIEEGKSTPTATQLVAFARGLGVPMQDLYEVVKE